MSICTYLTDDEFTTPTTNVTLNEVLAEVRRVTGRDWRVGERSYTTGHLWWRKTSHWYTLYLTTTMSEVQVINFWREGDCSISTNSSAERVIAYLYGVLAGAAIEKAKSQ